MSGAFNGQGCGQGEATSAFALRALPSDEAATAERHIASCADCRDELESLRAVVERFAAWPTDVLRPATMQHERLAARLGQDPIILPPAPSSEPDWEQVAPGIECKLLASDNERHRVSMLVRLARNASYPPLTHA